MPVCGGYTGSTNETRTRKSTAFLSAFAPAFALVVQGAMLLDGSDKSLVPLEHVDEPDVVLEADGLGSGLDLQRLDGRHTDRLRDAVGHVLVDSSEHGHYT